MPADQPLPDHTSHASPHRGQIQRRLAFFYVALFLVLGLHMPYWPVWLQDRGFDAREVAGLVALGLFMRVLSGPLLGAVVDGLGERRRPMVVLSALSLATFALFAVGATYPAVAVITVVSMTFYPALFPLIEALSVSQARERGFDYGRTRLWGSMAFVLANLAGGFVLRDLGAPAILPILLAGLALTTLMALALPSDRAAATVPRGPQRLAARLPAQGPVPWRRLLWRGMASAVRLSSLGVVASSFRFWLFALSAGLIQSSHAFYYGFSSIHWQSQGFSGDLIGLFWAVGVMAEILLFSVSGRVLARLGPVGLLALGGGAAVVRWSILASDPGLGVLVAVQMLHAFTFGATHLGTMHLIDRAVPAGYAVTAQSLYYTLSGGIILGLATVLAGDLYTAFAGQAFLAMTVMAAVGLTGVMLLARALQGSPLVPDPAAQDRTAAGP